MSHLVFHLNPWPPAPKGMLNQLYNQGQWQLSVYSKENTIYYDFFCIFNCKPLTASNRALFLPGKTMIGRLSLVLSNAAEHCCSELNVTKAYLKVRNGWKSPYIQAFKQLLAENKLWLILRLTVTTKVQLDFFSVSAVIILSLQLGICIWNLYWIFQQQILILAKLDRKKRWLFSN